MKKKKLIVKHSIEKYFFKEDYINKSLHEILIEDVSVFMDHCRLYYKWKDPIVVPLHLKLSGFVKTDYMFKDKHSVVAPRLENISTHPKFDQGDCIVFLADQDYRIWKWLYNSTKKETLSEISKAFS